MFVAQVPSSISLRADTEDYLGIFKCSYPLNIHVHFNIHFRLILEPETSLPEGISQVLVDSTYGGLSPKLLLLGS